MAEGSASKIIFSGSGCQFVYGTEWERGGEEVKYKGHLFCQNGEHVLTSFSAAMPEWAESDCLL